MGFLKNLFSREKKYTCEKCGKSYVKSHGGFILRNKKRFCCKNCCGEAIAADKKKSNKKEVCEFC